MSKKRKRAESDGDVRIAVVVTVHAEPNTENVGTYFVNVEIDGPEHVVAILRAAYKQGRMSRGIDAFTAAAIQPIAAPEPVLTSRQSGRA